MQNIIKTIFLYLDPNIDYQGQKLADDLMKFIFVVGYAISFVVGMFLGNLKYTLYGGIATVVINLLLTIPAWSYFRQTPLKFKKYKTQ
ncbi:hypothetical protein NUSPORA_00816 [Nucleospora cyclopteri]